LTPSVSEIYDPPSRKEQPTVRISARGLVTLGIGFGATWALAASVTLVVKLLGLLPRGFSLGEIAASETHVNASTTLVSL
jgi:hypothetical protein